MPFKIAELPKIDFVLISHAHYDHLDYPTVKALGNAPRWYVPLGLKGNALPLHHNSNSIYSLFTTYDVEWFESCGITNVEEMGWWDTAKYVRTSDGKEIEVACTPCQHWANRTLTDKCKTLWASWVVMGKKQRVFFAGEKWPCFRIERLLTYSLNMNIR